MLRGRMGGRARLAVAVAVCAMVGVGVDVEGATFLDGIRARQDAASCPSACIYFGAKPGWRIDRQAFDDIIDTTLIDEFESTGRRMEFATFSVSWHDGLPRGEGARTLEPRGDADSARVLVPDAGFFPDAVLAGADTHSSIVAGAHDDELRKWARSRPRDQHPDRLRLRPEMNSAHPAAAATTAASARTATATPPGPTAQSSIATPSPHRDDLPRGGLYQRHLLLPSQHGLRLLRRLVSRAVRAVPLVFPRRTKKMMDRPLRLRRAQMDGQPGRFVLEEKLQTFHAPDMPGSYAENDDLRPRPLALNEVGLYKMPTEQENSGWVRDAAAATGSGRYPRLRCSTGGATIRARTTTPGPAHSRPGSKLPSSNHSSTRDCCSAATACR